MKYCSKCSFQQNGLLTVREISDFMLFSLLSGILRTWYPMLMNKNNPIVRGTHRSYLQGELRGFRAWGAMSGIFPSTQTKVQLDIPSSFQRDPETQSRISRGKGPNRCDTCREVRTGRVAWNTSAPFPKKQSLFVVILSYAFTPPL